MSSTLESSANMELLAAAMSYFDCGMSVIPVCGKHPALRSWKPFQTERAGSDKLRAWFGPKSQRKVSGLAVVLGKVSGGLACRDFDDAGVYESWAHTHPALSSTLPTVQTARGFHVYAKCPGVRTLKVLGGELRGEGAYVLLPPSAHPAGGQYTQLVPFSCSDLPKIDPAEAGFLSPHETERTESTETTETTQDNLMHTDAVEWGCSVRVEIARAIETTLPKGTGTRHRLVFELARALKGLPTLADAPPGTLKPYVRRWHARALPYISTKEFEETWIDFRRAWDRVKWPKGCEPMSTILERAVSAAPPTLAAGFDGDGPKLLACICREMQRISRDGVFYLSARTAGELLGTDHVTAWRWLFLLTDEGILSIVEVGGREHNPRKATRYRYIAPD